MHTRILAKHSLVLIDTKIHSRIIQSFNTFLQKFTAQSSSSINVLTNFYSVEVSNEKKAFHESKLILTFEYSMASHFPFPLERLSS